MTDEKKSIKIVIAGDILPSGKNIPLFEKGDVDQLFGNKICNLFKSADFSIVNLEGPLTDSIEKQDKVDPILKASKKSIAGIKNLGVSAVALANNHITDYLQRGVDDTLSVLEEKGIDYVGIGKVDKCKTYLSVNILGKSICIYNVSEAFFNAPGLHYDGANLYDEWLVLNELKELKQTHDYLIVIYHGGAEEFPYPTPLVKKRFHRMADCGADFITAQHTHCIGCEEWYNNSYLLYGQGNFLFSRMKNPITKKGLVTEIVFEGSDCPRIINHIVNINVEECMEYSVEQNLSEFYTRSNEIDNEEMIKQKYSQFTYCNPKIKHRNLKAYKGKTIGNIVLPRLAKNYYNNQYLESYYHKQLLRMMILQSSERYSEDFLTCLTYMINKENE